MTEGKRKLYNDRLEQRYIPYLHDAVTVKKLDKLHVTDIIAVYKRAVAAQAAEKPPFDAEKKWEAGKQLLYVRSLVMSRMKQTRGMYVIMDSWTKAPYVGDGNSVFLYTDEMVMKECLPFFREGVYPSLVRRAVGVDSGSFFEQVCFLNGIDSIQVNSGIDGDICFPAIDFTSDVRAAETADGNIYMDNPFLFLAVTRYLQEARRRPEEHMESGKMSEKLWQELAVAMFDACPVLPLNKLPGKHEMPERIKEYSFATVTKGGVQYYPLFTDGYQAECYYGNRMGRMHFIAEETIEFLDLPGPFLVNPATFSYEITLDDLRKMYAFRRGSLKKLEQHRE